MADNNQVSSLELSDEEFMKQGSTLLATANELAAEPEKTDDTQTSPEKTETSDDAEAVAAQAAKAAEVVEEDSENKELTDTEEELDGEGKPVKPVPEDPAKKVDEAKPAPTKSAETPAKAEVPNATNIVDYKAEYERLLAPFKANGRDIKVENVDEAVRLMQMGANYNRKMAALKPNLAIMKMLENNKLVSPDQISFLIDLHNKNPEAISKLIKDSGVDPLDITTDKAAAYKPGNHAVSDVQVELDNVLDEIADSPKYAETLDLVAKQWDPKSKQLIAAQPNLIKVINGHMENGIYDLISTELERKKLFGGLNGLSDLEAYRQIGDAMAADGKFDHVLKKPGQATQPGQQTPVAKTVVTPNPKKADDSKREEQRRAAAPAKGAAPTGKLPAGFNPLALSDEEFAKFKPTF